MAIVKQHQPRAAYIAGLAQYVGQGQANRQSRAEMMQLIGLQEQARQFDASQQMRGQMFLADQQMQQQRLQQQQNQFDANQQFQQGMLGQRHQQQLEMMDIAAQQQAERDARIAELRKQGLEEEYTFRQKQDMARLDAAESEVNQRIASGQLPEQVGQQYLDQIFAQRNGIKPVVRPAEKSPWPEGQDVGQVWEQPDPISGANMVMTRDHLGNVKVLREPPPEPKPAPRIADSFTPQVSAAMWRDALESSRGINPLTDKPGEANPEKARQFYTESVQMFYQSRKMLDQMEQMDTVGQSDAPPVAEVPEHSLPQDTMSAVTPELEHRAAQIEQQLQGAIESQSPVSGQQPMTTLVERSDRPGVFDRATVVRSLNQRKAIKAGEYYATPAGIIKRASSGLKDEDWGETERDQVIGYAGSYTHPTSGEKIAFNPSGVQFRDVHLPSDPPAEVHVTRQEWDAMRSRFRPGWGTGKHRNTAVVPEVADRASGEGLPLGTPYLIAGSNRIAYAAMQPKDVGEQFAAAGLDPARAQAVSQQGIHYPANEAEARKLPSDALYMGSDGLIYRKP